MQLAGSGVGDAADKHLEKHIKLFGSLQNVSVQFMLETALHVLLSQISSVIFSHPFIDLNLKILNVHDSQLFSTNDIKCGSSLLSLQSKFPSFFLLLSMQPSSREQFGSLVLKQSQAVWLDKHVQLSSSLGSRSGQSDWALQASK